MTTCYQIEPDFREVGDKTYNLVSLNNHLDDDTLPDFSAAVEPLIQNNHTYLVFDLGELDLLNSHAVGYFENIQQRISTTEKQMALVNANEEIFEILEFIGLAKLIATYEAEEKFLEAMTKGEI